MKKSIGVCLVCACLLALGSCATQPEKVTPTTTKTNTSSSMPFVPDTTSSMHGTNGTMGGPR